MILWSCYSLESTNSLFVCGVSLDLVFDVLYILVFVHFGVLAWKSGQTFMLTIVCLWLFWDSLLVRVPYTYVYFIFWCMCCHCTMRLHIGCLNLDLNSHPISAVTFSRLEPEGKLVMGFRKASAAPPSDQVWFGLKFY